MRVKICGITRVEDAMCPVERWTDALGFVFYEASPRYISPQEAKRVIQNFLHLLKKLGCLLSVVVILLMRFFVKLDYH